MYHLRASAPPSLTLRMMPAAIYIFPRFKNVCEYSQTWPKTEETALLRRILKSAQKAKKWTLAIVLHHFFGTQLQLLSGDPAFRTKKRLQIGLFFIVLLGAALAA